VILINLEDNLTSKNYTNHEIIVRTDELAFDESIHSAYFLNLNESDYFEKIRRV
jgi:hypothetical protein